MAVPTTRKFSAYVALVTLAVAVGVIGYQVGVRGCNVDSLGAILQAKFSCPRPTEVAALPPVIKKAPGQYIWLYNRATTRCDIPIQKPPVGNDSDIRLLSVSVSSRLTDAVLPYGDVGSVYQCSIKPRGSELPTALDTHDTASYQTGVKMEARFDEQGRKCGILWRQLDWTTKDHTVEGARIRKKFCADNGSAIVIEDLN